ncbi:WSC-domain-containing protein [Polyplosphaeria fusca]|uniref:WSC-domain-containing protein n=1 Tax=Polyplosphaeria fusca TaxID=682080 RepID=A0A9P4V806_9PLEO|nr:WSC-domain-containing protein [Polyplosphaeria fusca]
MHSSTFFFALGLAWTITPIWAYLRMSCPGRLVRERLDPVVSPGVVSGHVHTISGGSGFAPNITYQQARASKCSSCQIKEDLSNYWTPQLYFQAQNGSFIPVPVAGDGSDLNGGMIVYYLQRPGKQGEKLKTFPEGFRMLAGDTFKRNFTGDLAAKAVTFNCLQNGSPPLPETNALPNYNCPGGLRAQLFFPSCWNGRDLDTPDHRSHVSYFNGTEYNSGLCPSNFPIHMVSIFFEVLYDTNRFKDMWYGNQQPFVFANGDPTGYGFHGDFVNGWDTNVLQNAIDNCNANNGDVSACSAVTMFSVDECNACKLPTVVAENTDGWQRSLPGCNPVQNGPAYASRVPCPVTPLSDPKKNYVDLIRSKGWEYTGCGTDNIQMRTFTLKSTSSNTMTVESCIDFCSSAGYTYAGVEYSAECYCDNSLPASRAPKDGIYGGCNFPCAGNSSQSCGGSGFISIYHRCTTSCKNTDFPPTSSSSSTAPVASPSCPKNNCNNQIFVSTASVPAQTFCPTYTATWNVAASAIPSYLGNCSGDSVKNTAAPTTTTTRVKALSAGTV